MILQYLQEHWLLLIAAADRGLALAVSSHVVLTKRDSRAAVSWVGLIWLTPLLGSVLYWWLGINRIERRARLLRRGYQHPEPLKGESCSREQLAVLLGSESQHLCSLATLVGSVTRLPLLSGNTVVPLINGDQAYPEMLAAIDGAKHSVSLCTYIFDKDRIGLQFLHALQRARARGVEVRVLIDGMGARYSWPRMTQVIRKTGIPCATFMPPTIPWRFQYSNLRTHRKLLVVDGATGFTGGINIREGHCLEGHPRYPVRDVHFRIEGPVISQIQRVFADDWSFCMGEILTGDAWFPGLSAHGDIAARGISDGPDEDLENFRNTILGAIASAEYSVRIVTPYFLPDPALIAALNVAALRNVSVDIVLPGDNNIPIVHWACLSLLPELIERGCRIWISPPPFDHSKLMVIDEAVSLIGSSNWDPRSLRLNFEFNLECYSTQLARRLTQLIQERIRAARLCSLSELRSRSIVIRLRDGISRLLLPYL